MKTTTIRQIRVLTPVLLFSFVSAIHWPWTTANLDHFRSPEGLRLSDNEISLITSAFHLGRLTGAVLEIFLLQKCGRKTHFIVSALLMFIGTSMFLFLKTTLSLSAARLFIGMGVGLGDMAARMYVGEVVSKKLRGALITTVLIFFFVGLMAAYAAPICFRFNHILLTLIAVNVFFLLCTCDLVESPYFLLVSGQKAKALRSLTWLNDYEHQKAIEELRVMEEQTNEAMNVFGLIRNFRRPEIHRTVLIINSLGVILALLMTVTNSFANLVLPKMDSTSSNAFTVGSTGLILLATCAASFVVDGFGRRSLLVWGFTFQTIAHASIAVLYYLHDNCNVQFSNFTWLMFGSITLTFLVNQFACLVPYTVVRGEIFSANFKNIAMGTNVVFNSIVGIIFSYLFLPIIAAYGIFFNFLIFSVCSLLGLLFVLALLPETKNKSLTEIQLMLQKSSSMNGINNR